MANDVRVNFLGDSSSLDRAMAGVRKDIGTTEGTVKKKFGGIGLAAGLAGGALAVSFGKKSIDAFKESEEAQNRLSDAFKKFPNLADVSRDSLNKLNTELSKKTVFDDDATASGQAVLAQFGLTGAEITKMTPLLQDYAAKTGKDLPAAAEILGKALLGKGKALGEVGIKFKDAGSQSANYEQIMAGLRTQVGGFAESEGKTAAGQAAILGNQFGEVQETVGAKLVPVLTKLAGILLTVIEFVQNNSAALIPLVAVMGTLAAIVYTIITAQKIWTAVQAAFNIVMDANPVVLIIIGIVALIAAVVLAYQHSQTFRDIVAKAFDVVKAAAGVLADYIKIYFEIVKEAFEIVKTAAGLLWDGIKIAFDFIKGAFKAVGEAGDKVWDVLKGAFRFIVDAFLGVAQAIVDGAAHAFGWIPGLGGKLKDAAADFAEFRDSVNAKLNGIHDKVVNVTINERVNQANGSLSMIGRAIGGPVTAGAPYIVGERGPEVFVPRMSGTIIPNGPASVDGGVTGRGGGNIIIQNLNVHAGMGVDGVTLGQQLVQTVLGYKRTLGGGELGIG